MFALNGGGAPDGVTVDDTEPGRRVAGGPIPPKGARQLQALSAQGVALRNAIELIDDPLQTLKVTALERLTMPLDSCGW